MANKLIPCGGFYFKDEQIQFEKTPDGQPLINIIGDGAGVTDYTGLTGKPQIGGKELKSGDNTLESLGIQAKGNYLQQGTKIPATDITEDTTHKFVTDNEKTKLNGIADNANNYTLPVATENSLGGMKKAKSVSVIGTDGGTTISGTFTQEEVQKILDLANANKNAINGIINSLKASGIMS